MKLKIDYIDENTGQRFIIKNKHLRVYYHDSNVHDSNEFEELTGKVLKLDEPIRSLVSEFYKLSSLVLNSK